MEQKNKETVGAASLRLQEQEIRNQREITHSAEEQMRAHLSEYEDNVLQCIHDNKNLFEDHFYVVVLTKKERLMQNVLRNYFFARRSCPTPDYDQTVYKYTKASDNLEYMWTIPAADVVECMKVNKYQLGTEAYELLGYVMSFLDGSLLRLSKKINRERAGSNILEKD